MIRGTLPPDDPRNRATIRAVTGELTEDGYVYRFRHDARPLHKSEGAFLLCGFWMAQVAQACGDTTAAARWFERSRAACGPAGLDTRNTTSTSASCGATCPRLALGRWPFTG